MRIAIDRTSCDLHGLCAEAAPELFELTDDEVLLLDEDPTNGSGRTWSRRQRIAPKSR